MEQSEESLANVVEQSEETHVEHVEQSVEHSVECEVVLPSTQVKHKGKKRASNANQAATVKIVKVEKRKDTVVPSNTREKRKAVHDIDDDNRENEIPRKKTKTRRNKDNVQDREEGQKNTENKKTVGRKSRKTGQEAVLRKSTRSTTVKKEKDMIYN